MFSTCRVDTRSFPLSCYRESSSCFKWSVGQRAEFVLNSAESYSAWNRRIYIYVYMMYIYQHVKSDILLCGFVLRFEWCSDPLNPFTCRGWLSSIQGPGHSGSVWLNTYIASITAHFIEGLYGPCFSAAPFELCSRRLKMRWAWKDVKYFPGTHIALFSPEDIRTLVYMSWVGFWCLL